jgi:hypothetical protein
VANYAVTLQRTLSTTASIGTVTAPSSGTPRRGKVYSITLGSEATPADTGILFQVQRVTAPGTGGTAPVPQALDMADSAAISVANQAPTAEPTYTGSAVVLSVPFNQRSTIVWTARPGKELVYPATLNYGLGLRTPTINTTGPAATATVFFEEQ